MPLFSAPWSATPSGGKLERYYLPSSVFLTYPSVTQDALRFIGTNLRGFSLSRTLALISIRQALGLIPRHRRRLNISAILRFIVPQSDNFPFYPCGCKCPDFELSGNSNSITILFRFLPKRGDCYSSASLIVGRQSRRIIIL